MQRAFRIVYGVLVLNFALPVVWYALDPQGALGTFVELGRIAGVESLPRSEDSTIWRVLAIANVATLAFSCALLFHDLRRWFPILVPLVFLKAMASAGFGVAYLFEAYPGYLGVFFYDGITVWVMWFFATRAKRELDAAGSRHP